MLKKLYIGKEKLLVYAALFLALAGMLYHMTLHYTLILDPMPLTMREPAPVLISESYANELKEGFALPYSVEAYPQATSVYGPVYTIITGLLQLALDADPYLIQRCFVGLIAFASSLLCGFIVTRFVDFHSGLLATLWLYLSQVTCSTVAAGPSALAVLFYILGIAAILYFGVGWRGLCLSMLAGILGLLTKPYVALIIPAALTYVYLFHSPRRALIVAAGTVTACGLVFYLVSILMPTYFHSVFIIHSANATWLFGHLVSQTVSFSKLNFGLLAAYVATFPLAVRLIPNWTISSLWGSRGLISPDIGFDRFLVLVVGAALFISLGGHGGAYLIYFNHLLLPGLLIAGFRYSKTPGVGSFVIRVILLLNVAYLYLERPPLREDSVVHLAVMNQTLNKKVLVDPIYDPIARSLDNVDVIDNGQTEYLVQYDLRYGGPFAYKSEEWSDNLVSMIANGEYEGIYLSRVYYRNLLLYRGVPSDLLHRYYERDHVALTPVYYAGFKDRSSLGQTVAEVFYYKRREEKQHE